MYFKVLLALMLVFTQALSIYLSIYIIESVRLFVCLFAVNTKTTARIDAKRSGITKNDRKVSSAC